MDTATSKVVDTLRLDKEADRLMQDLAVMGDKGKVTASKLLEYVVGFAGELYKVPTSKRKPTWFKEVIDLAVGAMYKSDAISKRVNNAFHKAYELKEIANKGDAYPVILTVKNNDYVKCQSGDIPALTLDTETCMGFTVSAITAWTSKGAKDPKNSAYDKLGVARKGVVMPERKNIGEYRKGAKRDMKSALTKALKRKLGVPTNVKADTEPTKVRIPISIATIVKYRDKGISNGDTWSQAQTDMFEQGVALIEKSCNVFNKAK